MSPRRHWFANTRSSASIAHGRINRSASKSLQQHLLSLPVLAELSSRNPCSEAYTTV
jgi:hypothetical protein